MNDVSNRTLVLLAAIAIIFTMVGTSVILSNLGYQPISLITGLAPTQAAYVNVTVAASTSITLLSGGNVSFGNGSAAGGVALSTASGTDNPNTFSDPTSAAADDFLIENDGNVDVNLTINGSKASDFITTGTGPAYNWSGTNRSALADNGCYNVSGVQGGPNQSQNPFGQGPAASVCQNLSYRDANDTVNVTIRIYLPADTLPGTYIDSNILFTAARV